MTVFSTVFSVMAVIGWVGALAFLVLFLVHPSTRKSRKSRGQRLFYLFIVADSAVMLMIYTTALLNLFLHTWPLKDAFRMVLGVSALGVIWWRVALFWGLNMRNRRNVDSPAEGSKVDRP